MRFSLSPPPRVLFIRVGTGLGFTGQSLAHELGLENYMITSFSWPVEAMVEEFLAPLYEEDDNPIQASDLLRAGWQNPIPGFAMMNSPSDLVDKLTLQIPFALVVARVKHSIAIFLGNPAAIPTQEPGIVAVADANTVAVNGFFDLKWDTVEVGPEHCLFIRLVADSNFLAKTYIFNKVPCHSINLMIPEHSSAADAAKLIATSTFTPPNVEFSFQT